MNRQAWSIHLEIFDRSPSAESGLARLAPCTQRLFQLCTCVRIQPKLPRLHFRERVKYHFQVTYLCFLRFRSDYYYR